MSGELSVLEVWSLRDETGRSVSRKETERGIVPPVSELDDGAVNLTLSLMIRE